MGVVALILGLCTVLAARPTSAVGHLSVSVLDCRPGCASTGIPELKLDKGEAQGFRCEVNGSVPLSNLQERCDE